MAWVHTLATFHGPDGRPLLAIGSDEDNTVWIRDMSTGARIGAPIGDQRHAIRRIVSFTAPDGRILLAIGSDDPTVRIWDPLTGALAAELTGHTGSSTAMAVVPSPDGPIWIATGNTDNTVRIWDPIGGRQIGEPIEHAAPALAAVTDPDGRVLLAAGSLNGPVRIWDTATREEYGPPLTGHAPSSPPAARTARYDCGILRHTASAPLSRWVRPYMRYRSRRRSSRTVRGFIC
jgi:WD40 repeat protein